MDIVPAIVDLVTGRVPVIAAGCIADGRGYVAARALGAVGVLLGTLVGSETKTTTWAPVPLARLNVGPAPGGGLALGVRISF